MSRSEERNCSCACISWAKADHSGVDDRTVIVVAVPIFLEARMRTPAGRNLALSLPRRLICDLVHFAQRVPTVPVQRRMSLAPVVAARRAAGARPSWCAIFTKAYAQVAEERPELRRAYLSFPWPHLYEHSINVASIAVERSFGGEPAVFFAPLRRPERQPLTQLDAALRHCKDHPVEDVSAFRRALRISRLPRPLRRLAWWLTLNAWGRKRAHYMGTFGVSVYAGLGAASLHPLSPLTTTLNYGVIEADGTIDVRLVYDHRVLDGATVARALVHLETVLQGEITRELQALQPRTRVEAA
jgi:hypothetical protein